MEVTAGHGPLQRVKIKEAIQTFPRRSWSVTVFPLRSVSEKRADRVIEIGLRRGELGGGGRSTPRAAAGSQEEEKGEAAFHVNRVSLQEKGIKHEDCEDPRQVKERRVQYAACLAVGAMAGERDGSAEKVDAQRR